MLCNDFKWWCGYIFVWTVNAVNCLHCVSPNSVQRWRSIFVAALQLFRGIKINKYGWSAVLFFVAQSVRLNCFLFGIEYMLRIPPTILVCAAVWWWAGWRSERRGTAAELLCILAFNAISGSHCMFVFQLIKALLMRVNASLTARSRCVPAWH